VELIKCLVWSYFLVATGTITHKSIAVAKSYHGVWFQHQQANSELFNGLIIVNTNALLLCKTKK
jgi:hypothetical protein